MGKLLLMIFLGVAIWWLWRKLQATKADAALPKAERPPELMARCAHCGVNQPRSECVEGAGQAVYCSDAHRREAESGSAGE